MTLKEAVAEVEKAATRSGYDGILSAEALEECARVYLDNCTEDGSPRPRTYMKSGDRHRQTNLSEIQWLLVRTPKFKRWFENSVVVDENGDPKVMYHGTWKKFDEFKPSAIKLPKVAMTMWSGPGFYFTDREEIAKIYAGENGKSIYSVFLRLKNPLIVDETGNSESKGISKDSAIKIFLAGDNTQWLDAGLASELARMDIAEGKKSGGKHYYKSMTRSDRVAEYVSRLKTDVVKLKTAALAYGARSQGKLLEAVCKFTGHDGVIHTITPEVKEWVVYDPTAVKSASNNDGDFDGGLTPITDSVSGEVVIRPEWAKDIVSALRRISDRC